MTGISNNLPSHVPFDQERDVQSRQMPVDRKKMNTMPMNYNQTPISPTSPPYAGTIGSSPHSKPQHHSQPLHYRTNFGKDYGYRPPSPASPLSTPTLLTQWSTQQIVERKRQQMLDRQQHWQQSSTVANQQRHEQSRNDLRLPHLRIGTNNAPDLDGKNIEETPFDERDEGSHLRRQQLFVSEKPTQRSPANTPAARTMLKFEGGEIINNRSLPGRAVNQTTQPRSPSLTAINNSGSLESFNSSNHWSNSRIASPTLPRTDGVKLTRSVSPAPRESRQASVSRTHSSTPPRALFQGSHLDESRHVSPIARMAATQNRSILQYNVPAAVQSLYSSPVRLSSPKQSLTRDDDDKKNATVQESSPSDDESRQNPNGVDKSEDGSTENDEFDYSFEDDTYDKVDDDTLLLQQMVQSRCQIPKMRVSGPRAYPLGDLKASLSRKQYPVIGGPNMMTFTDETSVLTGDFGDDHTSEQMSGPPIQLLPNKDGSRDVAVIPSRTHVNRSTNRHIEALLQPEKIIAARPFLPSLTHQPQDHCASQRTTSSRSSGENHPLDELDQKSDSTTHMIDVVGVSRYLQSLPKGNAKAQMSPPPTSSLQGFHLKTQSAQQTNQTKYDKDNKRVQSPVTVQNNTSLRSDEDSLFDFIDSTTTASTEIETPASMTPEKSPIAVRKGVLLNHNRPNMQVSQKYEMKSQTIPHRFGNRFVSLLNEDTDEDTVNTSFDKDSDRLSDVVTPVQKRVQAAWKRNKALMNEADKSSNKAPSQGAKVAAVTMSKYAQPSSVKLQYGVKNGSDFKSKQGKTSPISAKSTPTDDGEAVLREEHSRRDHRIDSLQPKIQQNQQRNNRAVHSDASRPNLNDSYDCVTSATDGTQSLESLYTKSAESEVEDILKDIFMIGNGDDTNPGRRKPKYNSFYHEQQADGKNSKLDAMDEGASLYTETTDSADSSTPDVTDIVADGQNELNDTALKRSVVGNNDNVVGTQSPKTLRPTTKLASESNLSKQRGSIQDSSKDDDRLLVDVWSFVGTRISAVTSALGLDSGESASVSVASPRPTSTTVSVTSPPPPSSAMTSPSSVARIISPFSSPDSSKTDQTAYHDKGYDDGSRSLSFSGWNILDYASDVLLGPAPLSPCNELTKRSTAVPEPDVLVLKTDHSMLEDDARLLDLATQAAMSLHRIHGLEFDLVHPIDISRDIKFSVVDLHLPLGLIFQENDNGCWVTRVLKDGSAARTNAVEAGDQLIAVDGMSAVDMTVDEVAYVVRQQPHETVELTFLRYVSAFRPQVGSIIEEEGYEVMAKKESPGRLQKNKVEQQRNMVEQQRKMLEQRPEGKGGSEGVSSSKSCLNLMSKRSQNCIPAKTKLPVNSNHTKKSKGLLSSFRKTTTMKQQDNQSTTKQDDFSLTDNSLLQENDSFGKKRGGFRMFGRK